MKNPPEFQFLKTSITDSIGRLKLNRPNNLNALSLGLLKEIIAAAKWFDQQDNVRVVIVSGEGKAFSAGADLEGFPGSADSKVREAADAGRLMAEAVEQMRAITIAEIHGWCVGGGLVLAAACDLRVASETAKFSIPEIDLGIPLAWGGIPRLVREIGPAMTKELVMTCRLFSAQEAKSLNFLNRLAVETLLAQEVDSLAQSLVNKPKYPIEATKQHVNAVSAQIGDTTNSWADADSLLVGLMNEECEQARQRYLDRILNK